MKNEVVRAFGAFNVVLCSSEEDRETVNKPATVLHEARAFSSLSFMFSLCSLFRWFWLERRNCRLLPEPTGNSAAR